MGVILRCKLATQQINVKIAMCHCVPNVLSYVKPNITGIGSQFKKLSQK